MEVTMRFTVLLHLPSCVSGTGGGSATFCPGRPSAGAPAEDAAGGAADIWLDYYAEEKNFPDMHKTQGRS